MKKEKLFIGILAIMATSITIQSCNDTDDNSYLMFPTAVVTVCPEDDGSFLMRLDDNTTIYPANVSTSPFGDKEVRSFVNYTQNDKSSTDGKIMVNVHWMDSIRTKLPAPYMNEENAATYGNDPVEIVRDWVTVAEDGYLTLRLRTRWGYAGAVHHVNLLTGINPDDPFELELRHDAKGDVAGQFADAFIAFNLNKLPVADKNEPVKVKLHWNSFEGEKTAEFDLALRSYIDADDAAKLIPAARIK